MVGRDRRPGGLRWVPHPRNSLRTELGRWNWEEREAEEARVWSLAVMLTSIEEREREREHREKDRDERG